MFRFDYQKMWVVYLITTYTVFTIPEPVFAQSQTYNTRNNTSSAESNGGGGRSRSSEVGEQLQLQADATEGGAEPIVSGSSNILQNAVEEEDGENIIAEASNNRFRGPGSMPRKPSSGRPSGARRHPPPKNMSPIPPPPQRPLMLKPGSLNKPKPVPKYKHNRDSRESLRLSRPSPPHRDQSIEESSEAPSKYRKPLRDISLTVSKEEFFPSGGSSGGAQSSEQYSREKSRDSRPSSPPSPPSPPKRDSKSQNNPSPSSSSMNDQDSPFTSWPKQGKPVQLSYYYDSNDGQDLQHLVRDHHLRRKKDCDGLDNFVYDLDVIAFLLGVIAAGIGLYSDVIPFFNEGVKITYNNDLMGDGVDFPHDYWPKYDAQVDAARAAGTGAVNGISVDPQQYQQQLYKRAGVGSGRTISIGSKEDNVKEVLSVTGEFIGLLGLGISFIALFPHLVEKFFYSLDWWFGKRGLWKQYLYTYKCEIHPYPKPGWGRR